MTTRHHALIVAGLCSWACALVSLNAWRLWSTPIGFVLGLAGLGLGAAAGYYLIEWRLRR